MTTTAESRVGVRAGQKRRADAKLRRPCARGCGAQVWRHSTLCKRCYNAERAEHVRARREQIQRLWRAGASMKEIAAELGYRRVGPEIAAMRADGWDMPHRYRLSGK